MSHDIPELSAVTLSHLAEAGFLACDMGLPDQAISIFSGLALIQPTIPHPILNQAIVNARYEKLDQAIELLLPLSERFPQSQIVKAILGMLFVQQNDPRAISLLEEVIQSKSDVDAIAVAESCYELAQQQQASRKLNPPTEELQFFRHYNRHF